MSQRTKIEWTHDALAQSLADHLRAPNRMAWCDIQLGPSGSRRPDVYTIRKSYVDPRPTVYEVKVSVSDFRSDITSGKWIEYRKFASAIYFAVPRGLISRDEVPVGCGLYVCNGGEWRAAKKATALPVEIPTAALLKLIIDGVEREGPRYRARRWVRIPDSVRRRLGDTVAATVRDRMAVEAETREMQEQQQRIRKSNEDDAERVYQRAQETWAQLRAALDLPGDVPAWEVQSAVRRLRAAKLVPDEPVLREKLDTIQAALYALRTQLCQGRES